MLRIYDKCRRREPLSREEAYRLYDEAPLQELARWTQIRPSLLSFIQQTLDLLTRPLRDPQAHSADDDLSPRQWQILRLIAMGADYPQFLSYPLVC